MTRAALNDQLRDLDQNIRAARSSLEELVARVDRGPLAADRSMRTGVTCPACGCATLLHASEVLDRAESFIRSKRALVQPSRWRFKGAGHLEAWVCTRCGLVEWYVVDVAAALAADSPNLRVVRGEAQDRAVSGNDLDTAESAEPLDRLRSLGAAALDLRGALARQLSDLFAERGAMNRTMRLLLLCPLCGCRDILHARQLLDRADGPTRRPMALLQSTLFDFGGAGQFQAWVCTSCGIVEWYVPDLTDVAEDGQERQVLDGGSGAARAPAPLEPARLQVTGDDPSDDAVQRQAAVLSAAVAELAARLQDARARLASDAAKRPAMATDLRCPACGEGKIFHAASVLDRSEGGRDKMALRQPSLLRLAGEGTFAVWICTRCGLVEWRVPDIEDVRPDGKKLRLVEGARGGEEGPYR